MSFDTVEENAAFAEKFDFSYRLLSDTSRALGLAYGACDDASAKGAKRVTYVIGPDGTIKEAIASVDVKGDPAAILSRL